MKKQKHPDIAIIGGGPAGLMAAEILASAGLPVTVYERKPSLGRKFLMAGRGGLNITHSEPLDKFMARYGDAAAKLKPAIDTFPPSTLRDWCQELGEETFIGTSGRVFPKSFKASPLLRAWKARLDQLGVQFIFNTQWTGWDSNGALIFDDGKTAKANITILALGGASWPRLGSDGSWADILKKDGIPVTPLRAANCGFTVAWSEIFRDKFAGEPLKPVALSFKGKSVPGEAMISERGIEGGAVYALSSTLRQEIEAHGSATLSIDLRPGISADELANKISVPRGTLSFSNFLRKAGGLSPVAVALVREIGGKDVQNISAHALMQMIKALPLKLDATFPLDRAISSAGGIALDAVDENFLLKSKPGVYAIGEMLDWEAPTGGYLLQATFSTAVLAARSILKNI